MKCKRIFLSFCFAVFAMFFTGCFDVKQSLSFKNGTYTISYTIFSNKSILDGLSKFSGEDIDIDDLYDTMTSEFHGDVQNVSVEKFETAEHKCMTVKFNIDENADIDNGKKFLPVETKAFIEVPLLGGGNMSEEFSEASDNDFINLLLVDAKWTVYIDKSITKKISSVKISDQYNSGEAIPFTSTPKFFKIEIPMQLLTSANNGYTHLKIYR